MTTIDEDLRRQINLLVDAYRDRCLWFLRADYYPAELQDVLRTLDYIRRCGDREAFCKAGKLGQWLSRNSSKPSAASQRPVVSNKEKSTWQGGLYRSEPAQLRRDLAANNLAFHPGRIRGVYPQISR